MRWSWRALTCLSRWALPPPPRCLQSRVPKSGQSCFSGLSAIHMKKRHGQMAKQKRGTPQQVLWSAGAPGPALFAARSRGTHGVGSINWLGGHRFATRCRCQVSLGQHTERALQSVHTFRLFFFRVAVVVWSFILIMCCFFCNPEIIKSQTTTKLVQQQHKSSRQRFPCMHGLAMP